MLVASATYLILYFQSKEFNLKSEVVKFTSATIILAVVMLLFVEEQEHLKGPEPPYTAVIPQTQNKPKELVPVAILHSDVAVNTMDFSSDEQRLVVAGDSHTIQVWDIEANSFIHYLHTRSSTNNVRFMYDDQTIFVVSSDDVGPWLCNPKTKKKWPISYINFPELTGKMSNVVDIQKNLLAGSSYGEQGLIRIWDITKKTLVQSFSISSPQLKYKGKISMSQDQKIIAVCYYLTGGGTEVLSEIAIFDIETGKLLQTLQGHNFYWTGELAFSHDGNCLLAGLRDKRVIVWDLSHPENSVTFTGHKHKIEDVVFSPDGRWLVSVSGETTRTRCERGDINVWDIQNRKGVARLETSYPATTVRFSPTGKFLAVGTECNKGKGMEEIIIWDFNKISGKI